MRPAVICAMLLGLMQGIHTDAHGDSILHEERSLYSRILVKKSGSLICLQFTVRAAQRNQSCQNQRRPREMVFSYTRMSMTALLFTPRPASILVVGLGGGTLPTALRELFPTARIDAVEIDPAVIKVARQYFGFTDDANLHVHSQDARVWTKRALLRAERYDLIILDAFNGEYIPEHLMTQEYLQETRDLLAPGGTLVANTFTVSELYHHESATYADVFGQFINFKLPESANRVVLVPGEELSDERLLGRASALQSRLRPYNVDITRYTRLLLRQRKRSPDWDTNARILTDQYSPANLLQAQ